MAESKHDRAKLLASHYAPEPKHDPFVAGCTGIVVVGGVIGVGVDAATGATLDHYPNPVIIRLNPTGAPGTTTPAQVPSAPPAGVPVS